MSKQDDSYNDALVDTYRGLREINQKTQETAAAAAKPITPGAGVDPKKKIRPSKRLKNWHRATGASLKAYVRRLATTSGDNKAVALAWLTSKGCQP